MQGREGHGERFFTSGEKSLNGHPPGKHEAGLTCTNSSVVSQHCTGILAREMYV